MTAKNAPTAREIAQLLARLRRLVELGPDADPAEREAWLAAKRDVLARIEEASR